MSSQPGTKECLQEIAGYVGGVLVCLGVLTWVLQLWRADLSVPFHYGEDALPLLTFVKATLENGWYLHNPHLGAPWPADFHDYPMADSLHFGLMKLLGLLLHNPIKVANVYYLLTFPLATLATLFVLRRLEIAWGPALLVSLLFAFLPYHLERQLRHLPLSAYYLVPPTILVALWIGQERLSVRRGGAKFWMSVGVAGLVSCAGIYYAVFGVFFLLVAGLGATLTRRRLAPALTALVFAGVIAVGLFLNILPCLVYSWKHGSNLTAIARAPGHAEMFGLNISHLLLPIPQHRWSDYLSYFASHESRYGVSLGLIGSIGFVLLLVRFCLVRRTNEGKVKTLDLLSALNGCGVLLGTVGGFGFLFSFLVTPWIRCHYRICIFLAFFALVAIALLLEGLYRRFIKSTRTRTAYCGLLMLLLIGGVLDQTAPSSRPEYERVAQRFHADAAFIHRIEAAVGPKAKVFQLPYWPFPEAGPSFSYDHLRPYLHSRVLHWSFGAFKSREVARWQESLSQQPPAELVQTLIQAGFGGIYLDRKGYPDHGAEMEKLLMKALGSSPLISDDGRELFFSLPTAGKRFVVNAPAVRPMNSGDGGQ
jgi:phosphoglycerol transferase